MHQETILTQIGLSLITHPKWEIATEVYRRLRELIPTDICGQSEKLDQIFKAAFQLCNLKGVDRINTLALVGFAADVVTLWRAGVFK